MDIIANIIRLAYESVLIGLVLMVYAAILNIVFNVTLAGLTGVHLTFIQAYGVVAVATILKAKV